MGVCVDSVGSGEVSDGLAGFPTFYAGSEGGFVLKGEGANSCSNFCFDCIFTVRAAAPACPHETAVSLDYSLEFFVVVSFPNVGL